MAVLTRATRAISQRGGDPTTRHIFGDELGQMSAAFNRMSSSLETQRDLRRRLVDDVSHMS